MSTDASFRTATERQSWAHYYGRPLSWHDHLWNVAHHLPLMYRIWRLRPRSALEVASGTGSLGIFVSHFCPRVVSFDINPELVERCRENNRRLRGRVRFEQADAFDLGRFGDGEFDVAFSQGFFEHFADEDIARLLAEQLRVARTVVFSVPNDLYGQQDFGDERLLSKEEWDRLLVRLGYPPVASGNYTPFVFRLRNRPRQMYMAVLGGQRAEGRS